jgi:NAD(P)-dependent dehydrogenase (short-subunit alcohol dehydrogenase family)
MSYGPTKAGLEHLTGTMAREFAIHKVPIRVNCIAPGPFPSQRYSQEELDKMIKEGRVLGNTVRPPNDRSGRYVQYDDHKDIK